MAKQDQPPAPSHERVLAAVRDAGGSITSRTALRKALPDMSRAEADAALDYVMQLGWVKVGDNGTSLDLVNDPANPALPT